MRFSSFDHSAPDAPFEAVDALFTLRAEIARLRALEVELCDEILTFASELGCDKVLGVGRMAVIETRRPRRIAPEHLPQELLLNPDVFRDCEETVVLLAPRAAAVAATVAAALEMPVDLPSPEPSIVTDQSAEMAPEDLSLGLVSAPPPEPDTEHDVTDEPPLPLSAPLFSASDEISPELPDQETENEAQAEFTDLIAVDDSRATMRTIGAPLPDSPLDAVAPEHSQTPPESLPHESTVGVSDLVPAPGMDVFEDTGGDLSEDVHAVTAPFVQADDPFGLKTAAPRRTSLDLPPIEAGNAPEGETPRDLRPTGHADLQPLAGLHDENLAQMQADAEAPLAPATLPDALDLARALEMEADLGFAQAIETEEDAQPATAFASRRLAIGGEG
ncbi:hypothetical protein [Celeribacter sp. SCSIO 80788]|uniref:hypothetical protein n=1 Tax=Celeribacter sp. SCSIO 80788 TaxID=3117013 RepID=UPI003DA59C09